MKKQYKKIRWIVNAEGIYKSGIRVFIRKNESDGYEYTYNEVLDGSTRNTLISLRLKEMVVTNYRPHRYDLSIKIWINKRYPRIEGKLKGKEINLCKDAFKKYFPLNTETLYIKKL